MKKYFVYILVVVVASSCITDTKISDSYLYLRFENPTTRSLSVSVFPIDRGYSQDTIWFTLQPGENFNSEQFVSELGPYDTFHPNVYPVFILDSAQVIFSDSLLVTHYSRVIPYDSLSSPSDPIYYQQPRNIFNFDNYSIEKINENDFEATYVFTESDLNYADSIHE